MNAAPHYLTSSSHCLMKNNYLRVHVRGITLEDMMDKALTFDFNKYLKEKDQTFESRFMERTANELGNLIKPAVAEVIILQFRKFIAVMAYNLITEREADIQPDLICNYWIKGKNVLIFYRSSKIISIDIINIDTFLLILFYSLVKVYIILYKINSFIIYI